MKSFQIKITTIKEIKEFVKLNEQQSFDIDAESERYTVDAKSPMGLFSMNLKNPILIICHTDNEREIRKYERTLQNIFQLKSGNPN